MDQNIIGDKIREPVTPADFGVPMQYAKEAQNYANWLLHELRKDAERYRWLRDGGFTVLDGSSGYIECCGVLTGVGLDAAIDAEMAGPNG